MARMQRRLQRLLSGMLVMVVGLPIVIGVVAGLSGLLESVGDPSGAVVCRWVAVAAGAAWAVAIVAAVVVASLTVLTIDLRDRRRAPRWRRRDGRRRRPLGKDGQPEA